MASSSALPVLQVQALCFAFADQPPLFTDWSMGLTAGVTRLVGDTGSGKTTLLRLLAGELRGGGQLTLNGRRLDADPVAYRQQLCWFDPRDPAWDALTPGGLMDAQRCLHPALDEAAWQRHLHGFDLLPHLAKPLYALSTGSRRKTGLAVALAAGASLTLLDEPTAGLDTASVAYLLRVLADVAQAARGPDRPDRPPQALLLTSHPALESVLQAGVIQLPDHPLGG